MNSKWLIRSVEIMIIPIGVIVFLLLFTFTIGWNPVTIILFWFLCIPLLANYLPKLVFKREVYPAQSILGLVIFYGFMVLMIYEHYQSDYFLLMMLSLLSNLVIILLIAWIKNKAVIPKSILHE
ncbi:MAG: hypothetical protein HKO89_03840 [Saprospiraceae bacterium]|nr:hypothetical protein [Bacteroidia bacterium]NNK89715.1 hypothetical protein [Saprospiraceae bacterium]